MQTLPVSTPSDFNQQIRARLSEFGFAPKTYEGQPEVFHSKTLRAWDMPYVREYIIDGDLLFQDSMVTVELLPNNCLQLSADTDYFEEPVPLDTDEAFALLVDAGAAVKREELSPHTSTH